VPQLVWVCGVCVLWKCACSGGVRAVGCVAHVGQDSIVFGSPVWHMDDTRGVLRFVRWPTCTISAPPKLLKGWAVRVTLCQMLHGTHGYVATQVVT